MNNLHFAKRATLGLAFFVFTAFSAYAQYCTPTYTTGTVEGDYCGYVGLGAISNTTGGAASPFYSDYTGMNADLTAGTMYTITLGSGSYTSNNDLAAWIDYNQDNDFSDVGELIGTVVDLGAFATGTAAFTVPLTALNGATRLRVREIYAMPTTPDACANYSFGETEDYTVTISGGGGGPGPTVGNYYIYSNTTGGEPWFQTTNSTAMTSAFGAEGTGWTRDYFETVDVATAFGPDNCFVFIDGSDSHAQECENFLIANMAAIEAWVSAGGKLLLNSAPNEGDGMSFGFGGTSLVYDGGSGSVQAFAPAHPIFSGPFTPVGTAWTGSNFSHAQVTGTGIATIINETGFADITLGEKVWGSGIVMFGGMTTNNFHSPLTEAANLRANILVYLSCLEGLCPAPTDLMADAITGTSANLSWAASDNSGGYHLSVYTLDEVLVAKQKVLGGATNWNVGGLTPGTDYAFHVRSICTVLGTKSPISYNYYFSTPARLGDENTSVSLYPNPSNGQFTLALNGYENNNVELNIYNSTGQIVYASSINVNSADYTEMINLGTIAPGMYQVSLTGNSNTNNYSIVITE